MAPYADARGIESATGGVSPRVGGGDVSSAELARAYSQTGARRRDSDDLTGKPRKDEPKHGTPPHPWAPENAGCSSARPARLSPPTMGASRAGHRRVKVRWVTPLGEETASMS